MDGLVNGTEVLISNSLGDVVGQMSATLTYNGTPIDLTNKALGGYVELLNGELSAKQLIVSGEIIYNTDDTYQKVRIDAINGTPDTYTIEYPSTETFIATMIPTALSDSFPHGDKVSTNITFVSTGPIIHNEITINALVTVLYPIQSFEDIPIQGSVSVSQVSSLEIIFETPVVSSATSIDEITIDAVIIAYDESEKEVSGDISIESIEQVVVLITYDENEKEISGTISVSEITKTEVLISYSETEKEISGLVSIESIVKA